MSQPYTNLDTATNLQPDAMREALMRIATILDGEKDEPGKMWSSDEIEWVADQIIGLGFTIRQPGEEYEGYEEDRECDGHESLDGAHMGESTYCDGRCKG